MLSSVREYYVDYLFNCSNDDKNSFYKSFGSTNITSDYDISILGKNAPEIMMRMVDSFLQKYNDSLAISFDTNIYCIGYFSSIEINSSITTEIGDNISIIKLTNEKEINVALIFSFLKLKDEIFADQDLSTNVKDLLVQVKKYKDKLQHIYDMVYSNAKSKYKHIKSQDTLDMIVRYKINAKISKKVYDELYHIRTQKTEPVDNLYELTCVANYFSIESYYTCATVNVVVLELQGERKNLQLGKFEYVCSAIENLGDFLNHCSSPILKTDLNSTLIKLSKYIYRIYYSLSKINSLYIKKTEDIETMIIKERGNISFLSEKQLNLLNYYTEQDSDDVSTYKTRIQNEVLREILPLI
jgi:hypothetical protein